MNTISTSHPTRDSLLSPMDAGPLPGQAGAHCPTAVWLAPVARTADSPGGGPRPGPREKTREPQDGDEAQDHGATARDAASLLAKRLNWLRAGVLGANDGVVSVAGLVIGVAAADPTNTGAIVAAGVAGILAGAVSMAAGEYVSVSTQSDTERALVERQRAELAADPAAGVDELASHYRDKGLSAATARQVAIELSAHDAVGAHLDAELGLREDDYTNPWHAALSSAVAFTIGSMLPMLAIVLLPVSVQIPLTFVAVLLGLALTGGVSAHLGYAPVRPAILRVVAGGALAMAVTWCIGHLIGVSV
ncbi:MAG: VIT family protein [Actinomyces sp.]|uniref:VIT1/CCC1 transporter family protein n=1 Tax=Actinomyces sp. TaxID=29317 RepID=UPI0026DC50B7|nr:VIT family protein [Actinomyces sp.]MDO4243068.1 VIT family protein [Actinomyces sp.]